MENRKIEIQAEIEKLGRGKETADQRASLKKELLIIDQNLKSEKEKEKNIRFNSLSAIEQFALTPKEEMKTRFELLNRCKELIFSDLYTIDGALYRYDREKGIHVRTREGIQKELNDIFIQELKLLPDTTTVSALSTFYNQCKKELNFSKNNTCISFKGEIWNIYTGEKVEKKPENIALIYLDMTYTEFKKDDSTLWRDHLNDQYGEEQTKAMLGFFYSALLNENLEIGAIIDSTGRSGKGTIQETLTELLGDSQCSIFQSYDIMEKFRLKSVLDTNIAFFDETEALSNSKFKSLTGSKRAKVELKGKDVESIIYTTTFIFFSNEIVQMKTFKFAEEERFCLFRGRGIKSSEKDLDFKPRMIKAKIELLKLILTEGMKYYHSKNGKILYHHNEMLEEYKETNNSIETALSKLFEFEDNNRIIFVAIDDIMNSELGNEWKKLTTTMKGKYITNVFGKDVKTRASTTNKYKLKPKLI